MGDMMKNRSKNFKALLMKSKAVINNATVQSPKYLAENSKVEMSQLI